MEFRFDANKVYVKYSREQIRIEFERALEELLSQASTDGAPLWLPEKNEDLDTTLSRLNSSLNNDCKNLRICDLLLFVSSLAIQFDFSEKFLSHLIFIANGADLEGFNRTLFLCNWANAWFINGKDITNVATTSVENYKIELEQYKALYQKCLKLDSEAIQKQVNQEEINSLQQSGLIAVVINVLGHHADKVVPKSYLKALLNCPHFFAGHSYELFKLRSCLKDISLNEYYKQSRRFFLDKNYSEMFNLKAKITQLDNSAGAQDSLGGRYINISSLSLSSVPAKVQLAEQTIRTARRHCPEKRITFITSMFKGDQWITGFMKNMVRMDEFEHTEMLIISAHSPGSEYSVIEDYLAKFPNIFYIELDFDPGLYEVWNIGCRIANSPLISNANLDDRKAKNFITEHLKGFDQNPSASLVSAPCYISKTPELLPENIYQDGNTPLHYYGSAEKYEFHDFFVRYFSDDGNDRIVVRNIPHCMPVWRQSLHEKYGYFNEYCGGATADFEFWIRCASQGEQFFNINIPLGVYYYSDTTTYSARQGNSLEKVVAKYILNKDV